MGTKIEWCDEVWNVVTGCTKIRESCKNCYAEKIAHRFVRIGTHAKHNIENYDTMDFNDVLLHHTRMGQPLHWRKPRRIFVCSMGDLFHDDVPFPFINRVQMIASKCRHHTFMFLTKRPKRILEFNQWQAGADDISIAHWPRNCWLGVSVSTQKDADELIPILLQIPAAVRFVSVEPLLEGIDSRKSLLGYSEYDHFTHRAKGFPMINWVICGCESGPNRRPMKYEWAYNLLGQCLYAKIPFFLKQMEVDGKVAKMPELDGKRWAEYPEGKWRG